MPQSPIKPVPVLSGKDVAHFWFRVTRCKTGCWLWDKPHPINGYATFWVNDTAYRAHRISWVLTNGPVPDAMHVLHRCDIRHCVNPDHLFLGTNYDNVLDKEAKGRGNQPRGEKSRFARLTQAQVLEVRRRRETHGESFGKLSKNYGVCRSTIFAICNRVNWRWLEDSNAAK